MGLEPAGYQSLSGKEHATSGKVTVNPFDLSTGFQPGDVISYIEMCGAIGVNLQRIPLTSTGLLMEGDSAQNPQQILSTCLPMTLCRSSNAAAREAVVMGKSRSKPNYRRRVLFEVLNVE